MTEVIVNGPDLSGKRWSYATFGQPSPYGHPTLELLQELAATGTDVWRTDQHGDVTVTFGPGGIVVASMTPSKKPTAQIVLFLG